jgi:hypothetical protein
MRKAKFKIGDLVSVNGQGKHEIALIDWHGKGYCDCCPTSETYYIYGFTFNRNQIINEDQLQKYTGN